VRAIEGINDPNDFSARKCGWFIKNRLNLERGRVRDPKTGNVPVTVIWDVEKMERLFLRYGKDLTCLTSLTSQRKRGG
jgi:hypothetical protein